MGFRQWVCDLLSPSDEKLQKQYVEAGAAYGDAVSYAMMGSVVGIREMRLEYERLEKEYADRGFRTVSLRRFVDYGGYGQSIDDVLGVKREPDEEPIYHADLKKEIDPR